MYPSQRKIIDALGLKLQEGTAAGETARAIIDHLKANGIPTRPKIQRMLEHGGYIHIKRPKNIKSVKGRLGSFIGPQKQGTATLVANRAKQGRIGHPGKPSGQSMAIALASVATEPLKVLLRSQTKAIVRGLKASGMILLKYHKTEGRLSIANPQTYIGLRSKRDNEETRAWRTYVNRLKQTLGKSTSQYFNRIEKLARKYKVKYKTQDKEGNPLSQLSRNLLCQIAIAKALKSNNKLRAKLNLKPI